MICINISQVLLCLLLGNCYIVLGYHDSAETVGYSALVRDEIDSDVSGSVFIPDAMQTFDENGKLISFNYYSGRTGIDIRFQIWRPVSGNNYQLIYETETITTSDTEGSYSYDITDNQWVEADDTIGIYTAGSNPLTYTVDTSCTLMAYPLDASSAGVGDTKTFSQVPSSDSSECRSYSLNVEVVYENVDATGLNCTLLNADDTFQFLQSSNYDGTTEYAENTHACWIFQADSSDKGIRITFENFDFEDGYAYGDGECAEDFLEFHDGEDFWEDILEELCGTSYPAYGINSTGSFMYMRMHSDDNGVNGLGFQLLYKSFDQSDDSSKKKDDPIQLATILCIVFAIIALLLIIPIIILWVKTKRQRDAEAKDRLKENDFLQLERSRPAAWSPEPPRPKPLPKLDIGKHREEFLKSKQARVVPEAPDYFNPRQPDGSETVKIKHWSKLTAGVRWNPVKKQFRVHDTAGMGESNS